MNSSSQPRPDFLPSNFAAPLILAQTEPHLILSSDSFIVLEANEAFASALGVTRKEVVGRSVLQWIANEQRKDFTGTLRMAGRHPLPPKIFFQWKVAGNTLLPMEIAAWMIPVSAHTRVLALSARPRTARGFIDTAATGGRLPLSALSAASLQPASRRMKTFG